MRPPAAARACLQSRLPPAAARPNPPCDGPKCFTKYNLQGRRRFEGKCFARARCSASILTFLQVLSASAIAAGATCFCALRFSLCCVRFTCMHHSKLIWCRIACFRVVCFARARCSASILTFLQVLSASAARPLDFARCNLSFALCAFTHRCASCAVRVLLCTLRVAQCALYCARYALRFVMCARISA